MSGNVNGHSWSKFFWRDWRNDLALRRCSVAARGFWMDCLCLMHEGTLVGYLADKEGQISLKYLAAIAQVDVRIAKRLLDELERSGVFSRSENGTIFCRRMVRDAEASEIGRENASKRWSSERLQPNGDAIGDAIGDPNAKSTEDRNKKERFPPNPPRDVGGSTPHSGDPAERENVRDFYAGRKQRPRASGTNPRAMANNPRAEQPKKRDYQKEKDDFNAKTDQMLRAAGYRIPPGWNIVGVAS